VFGRPLFAHFLHGLRQKRRGFRQTRECGLWHAFDIFSSALCPAQILDFPTTFAPRAMRRVSIFRAAARELRHEGRARSISNNGIDEQQTGRLHSIKGAQDDNRENGELP
jgi:hypothetical protein